MCCNRRDSREEAILELARSRQPSFISFDEWKILDEIELQRGADMGRSRVKFTTVEEMLEALGKVTEMAGAGEIGSIQPERRPGAYFSRSVQKLRKNFGQICLTGVSKR